MSLGIRIGNCVEPQFFSSSKMRAYVKTVPQEEMIYEI